MVNFFRQIQGIKDFRAFEQRINMVSRFMEHHFSQSKWMIVVDDLVDSHIWKLISNSSFTMNNIEGL